MQIVSNIALISINETLFIQLISFLLFVFVMNRIMFRPLQQSLEDRKAHISGLLDAINRSEKDLKAFEADLEKEERAIRSKSQEQSDELEASGETRALEILQQARGEINTSRENSIKEIDAALSKARSSLQPEAEALCKTIMEKVLNRQVSL